MGLISDPAVSRIAADETAPLPMLACWAIWAIISAALWLFVLSLAARFSF